jgi:Tfp pilus assembly protein PilX
VIRRTAHNARQRGYMVPIVLVALVAMLISGIALVRSMDTNQLITGNLAFRNATVHSADLGVRSAVTWLTANAGSAALNSNAPANGYYAVAIEPNWEDTAYWSQCATCTVTPASGDAAGNTIAWVVHRMCTAQLDPNDPNNLCSRLSVSSPGATGGSFSSDAANFSGTTQHYYRITVRVLGPRNTSTLAQSFVVL